MVANRRDGGRENGEAIAGVAVTSTSVINPGIQSVTVKLDEKNYLLWNQQVTTTLRGHGLKGYIEGTVQIPHINSPEFELYDRQDQLLVSWILSSVSLDILPNLVGCETTRQLWTMIGDYFAAQVSTKVMQYRRELQNCKKENLGMREYLTKLKSLWDTLQSCGHGVSEADLVHITLGGLGTEYDAVITALTTQSELPSWKVVSTHLLATKARILQNHAVMESSMSAHLVSQTKRLVKEEGTIFNITTEVVEREVIGLLKEEAEVGYLGINPNVSYVVEWDIQSISVLKDSTSPNSEQGEQKYANNDSRFLGNVNMVTASPDELDESYCWYITKRHAVSFLIAHRSFIFKQ